MSYYTIGYHDTDNKNFEIGEYAKDAYEAPLFAKEDVPNLKEHPFSLDYIKKQK
tara:strand:- start:489 stop:650 length:162 start_codon:yes stop_codon:yes gene_type:complete